MSLSHVHLRLTGVQGVATSHRVMGFPQHVLVCRFLALPQSPKTLVTKRLTEDYYPDAGQPINFRREILSTIPKLDEMARIVIPTHPPLKPHARMLHHFRFIKPLLSTDEFGLTPLHYYDSVIQIARMSSKELSKEEYELGRNVAEEIATSLDAVRMAMEDEATRGSRTSSTFDEGA
ncbi:hypothetical protein AX16_005619 [Volvariella volvacea WC 439]|nr:hypothetical protein AX16_005619 [Volvariella volvacea WC 439]